jgi:hypothetical protein
MATSCPQQIPARQSGARIILGKSMPLFPVAR